VYADKTFFGGYKQAFFDTVTFRIVTESGARLAGLHTGELQGVEDIPTKSAAELKNDKNVRLIPLQNWWIQTAYANTQQRPTDNLMTRKAIQAALNTDEIMDAATDGDYRLNVSFAYPTQPTYTDAGKETYNIQDTAFAKKYFVEAGYKNEPVALLTNKDYTSMYNAALVMSEQMKAVGINAQLKVVDWPTSIAMRQKPDSGWNFFFTGWGTEPSLGTNLGHPTTNVDRVAQVPRRRQPPTGRAAHRQAYLGDYTLSHHYSAKRSQIGAASTIERPGVTSMIRSMRNPAFPSGAANSSAVRSCPSGDTSMFRSENFVSRPSFGPPTIRSMIKSFASE
jgi:ABC-type transport system substrate-binding protein